MQIGIHQPNYSPWLGYFYKIQSSDHFIFLDDVQYTKNSYINRTQIHMEGKNKWMTIPVSFHLGEEIRKVHPSKETWARSHMDLLFNSYRHAKNFKTVMPIVEDILSSSTQQELSEINMNIIQKITDTLKIKSSFIRSSEIGVESTSPETRLIKLTQSISPKATYLSGKGGAKYQDEEKYKDAGLGFKYINFTHPIYDQGSQDFHPGLSILDALFHLGIEETSELLLNIQPGKP